MKTQNMRYKTKRFLGISIDIEVFEELERLRGSKRTHHSGFINTLLRRELNIVNRTGATSGQGMKAPEQPTPPTTEVVSRE
ncbi:MAG: hypothetical protein MIO93_09310 [ANME-2 cluster archaeon]|nr:hypothetical protein [ANME-2 cluster archaeon]